MSVTITLHAWYLLAYLCTGAVLWLPLEYKAWTDLGSAPRLSFWKNLRLDLRSAWYRPVTMTALWPVALWEGLR